MTTWTVEAYTDDEGLYLPGWVTSIANTGDKAADVASVSAHNNTPVLGDPGVPDTPYTQVTYPYSIGQSRYTSGSTETSSSFFIWQWNIPAIEAAQSGTVTSMRLKMSAWNFATDAKTTGTKMQFYAYHGATSTASYGGDAAYFPEMPSTNALYVEGVKEGSVTNGFRVPTQPFSLSGSTLIGEKASSGSSGTVDFDVPLNALDDGWLVAILIDSASAAGVAASSDSFWDAAYYYDFVPVVLELQMTDEVPGASGFTGWGVEL